MLISDFIKISSHIAPFASELVSLPATVLLTAIALQESGLDRRSQIGGPALSYWQMEHESIENVYDEAFTAEYLIPYAQSQDILLDPLAIWHACQFHDPLAWLCARLILLPDPEPLPSPLLSGSSGEAWSYYLRCWRPGKPDMSRWTGSAGAWATACRAFGIVA